MQRRHFMVGAGLLLGGFSTLGLTRALAASTPATVIPLRTLGATQRALLPTLCELIIPQTDTPGAIAAGVPAFVSEILLAWYTDVEFQVFAEGLQQLEQLATQQHGRAFLDCSVEQQSRVLGTLEQQANAYQRQHNVEQSPLDRPRIDEQAPFFSKLKELVVVGYYTSEAAARSEMVYLPVPNRYSGDSSLADSEGKQYVW